MKLQSNALKCKPQFEIECQDNQELIPTRPKKSSKTVCGSVVDVASAANVNHQECNAFPRKLQLPKGNICIFGSDMQILELTRFLISKSAGNPLRFIRNSRADISILKDSSKNNFIILADSESNTTSRLEKILPNCAVTFAFLPSKQNDLYSEQWQVLKEFYHCKQAVFDNSNTYLKTKFFEFRKGDGETERHLNYERFCMDDFKIIEWQERQVLENTKIILTSSDGLIQQIKLDDGKHVYLVPEEFYQQAKKLLQEES